MPRSIVVRAAGEHSAPGAPVNTAGIADPPPSARGAGPATGEVNYAPSKTTAARGRPGRPGGGRTTPLIAGIDLVGTVVESSSPRWHRGQQVLANGAGMSETRHGGLGALARPPAEALVALPGELTARQAAALGTAGYTAALSVLRIAQAGVESSRDEPILVTGATGGVGSVAVMLLSALGHHVAALTGRVDEFSDYLIGLGAAQIVDRQELGTLGRPLQKQRWAGVVDTVGGTVLANALAQTRYQGTVTACGLAASTDLPATVMPFILRAVTLAGIDSVQAPYAARQAAWALLAERVDVGALEALTRTVALGEAVEASAQLLGGQSHGRIVVDVSA